MNNYFASTWGQADRLATRESTRDKKKRKIERKKKKRCGFIMFVIESAAAGFDIPNDSLMHRTSRMF